MVSGRAESNCRTLPWQGSIVPLNYARLCAESRNRTRITCSSDKRLDQLGYLGRSTFCSNLLCVLTL